VNATPLKIALGAGLLALALALALTLSRAPASVARVSTAQHQIVSAGRQRTAACQAGELLPRRVSAIRLRVEAVLGPRVTVAVYARGRLLAHGDRGTGWTGGVVTLPVTPLASAHAGVSVCFSVLSNGDESILLVGEPTRRAAAASGTGGALSGRLRIEYLRAGSASWWSLATGVARRLGLGRAWSGTWYALLVLVLMGAVTLTCARVILRELG
jgi:hypothetical protein